ncbi:MAG TPA: DNA mismatch repair protein MutS [Candidatus Krumholzibacteria bacterium]
MSAQAEYSRRRGELQAELIGLERRWNRVAAARASCFLLTAISALLALGRGKGWWVAAAVGLALFVACVAWHQRLGARRAARLLLEAWYGKSLARLRGESDPGAPVGLEFLDESHPYAAELDLFGRDSIFAWICHAQSAAGRRRLADWLLHAAKPLEISNRQEAVAELRDAIGPRETMLVCASEGKAREAMRFREWSLRESPLGSLLWIRLLSFGIALGLCATLTAWLGFGAPPAWFLGLSLLGYAWTTYAGRRLDPLQAGLEQAKSELRLLRRLLEHVEAESFESQKLRMLHAEICRASTPASSRIAALERRFEFHEGARNALFAPVAALLLWRTQWACAIEAWRRAHAVELLAALDALSEYEALQSLARLAYECPSTRPVLRERATALLRAKAVGHPLLPDCVRNDLLLDADAVSIWMISGSNMSGKSTFLRAVGVNLLIAMAGGHVFADAMEFTPVALGASIRAGDSLSGGESRFAHELGRLKKIVAQSEEEMPVCFLLDELLHGTHSHDRRIGAGAILRRLIRRKAVGMVTTHDLALCEIKPELTATVRNVHFQDDVVDGDASFDYRLRDGVVEKSNALRLMKAAGLIED